MIPEFSSGRLLGWCHVERFVKRTDVCTPNGSRAAFNLLSGARTMFVHLTWKSFGVWQGTNLPGWIPRKHGENPFGPARRDGLLSACLCKWTGGAAAAALMDLQLAGEVQHVLDVLTLQTDDAVGLKSSVDNSWWSDGALTRPLCVYMTGTVKVHTLLSGFYFGNSCPEEKCWNLTRRQFWMKQTILKHIFPDRLLKPLLKLTCFQSIKTTSLTAWCPL